MSCIKEDLDELGQLASDLQGLHSPGELCTHLRALQSYLSECWDNTTEADHVHLLRHAVGLAGILASLPLDLLLNPTASRGGSPLPASSASLPILACAEEACRLAGLLLRYTYVGVQQGWQLEPALVFRLATCAGVALGPAAEAVQQAFTARPTTSCQQPPPAVLAHWLAECCAALLYSVGRLTDLVGLLGAREPAAAVRGTVCRPDKLVALCHKLAPVLQWCGEQLGRPPSAGVVGLVHVVLQHARLNPGLRQFLHQGPSGPALATLAVTYLLKSSQEVVPMQPLSRKQLLEAAQGGAALKAKVRLLHAVESCEAGCVFLEAAARWLEPDSTAAALLPSTASTLWLLRVTTNLSARWECLESAASALLLLVKSMPPRDPAAGASSQATQHRLHLPEGQPRGHRQERQRGQRAGQEEPLWLGVPIPLIEAAAVGCSALCAALEARWTGQLNKMGGQPEESPVRTQGELAGLSLSLTRARDAMVELALRLAQGSAVSKQPPPLQLLLAAMEAALRLACYLLGLGQRMMELPGAAESGLGPCVGVVIKSLLCSCCALAGILVACLCKELPPQQRDRPSGGGSGVAAAAKSGRAERSGFAARDSGGVGGTSSGRSSSGSGGGGSNGTAESSSCPPEGDDPIANGMASTAATATKVLRLLVILEGLGEEVPSECDVCFLTIAFLAVVLLKDRHSQLAGALIPLLDEFGKLSRSKSSAMVRAHLGPRWEESPALARLRSTAVLLFRLDALPGLAGLQLQEKLVPSLCINAEGLAGLALCSQIQPEALAAFNAAVTCLTESARQWQRSAALAVQQGLVEEVLIWALDASRGQAGSSKRPRHQAELRGVWELVSTIASTLLRQAPEGASETEAARKVVNDLQQLPAAKQRQQLGSHAFWHDVVFGDLLSRLEALAVTVAAKGLEDGGATQLRVARALATRVCANPHCTGLGSGSEGRVRSQRCSGCGLARYCSCRCQVADWEVHGRVCCKLRADMPTESSP